MSQEDRDSSAEGRRAPLFAKFGLTIYRKDIEDVLSGAIAHPWAAATVAAILISVAIIVLVSAGGIKPNLVVYVILGIPVTGVALLLLVLVMELKVKTLLPIVCVLVALLFMTGAGRSWIEYLAPNPIQHEEQQVSSSILQKNPNFHDEYETIAQAACTTMVIKGNHGGWTFAVKRQCDSSTASCETICGLQALHNLDGQTRSRQWSCLGGVHVYPDRPVSQPSTTSKPSIGFKVFWSPNYHAEKHCGPNYCCCYVV